MTSNKLFQKLFSIILLGAALAVISPAVAQSDPYLAMTASSSLSDSLNSSGNIIGAGMVVGSASAPENLFTLDECLQIAFENNRLISISSEKVTAAREKRRQISRSQLPVATILTQEQKLKEAASSSSRDSQDTHRITITDSAQIFGKNLSQRRAAEATIRAMDAERQRTILEVTFQVKKAFYDVLLTQDLIKVASDSLEQLQAHRDHTARLVEAGSSPRFDLVRAEVQLSSARPVLIRAVRARLTTMADLMHLLGLDPLTNAELSGSFPETFPEIPDNENEALALALRDRPDLAAARASEEAARQQVSVAKQALQPALQMTSYLERTRGLRAPGDKFLDQWGVTLGVNFPVFDSGLSRSQTREAQAGLRQATLNSDQTLSALKVEIRKAFSALQEALEVLHSQEKNVEQAMEAMSIAETAYETGSKTALDVLDAQLALTQTRNLRFQALRDRAVAVAQMEKALGRIPVSGNKVIAASHDK